MMIDAFSSLFVNPLGAAQPDAAGVRSSGLNGCSWREQRERAAARGMVALSLASSLS